VSKVKCGIVETCRSLDKDSHYDPNCVKVKILERVLKEHVHPVFEYFKNKTIVTGISKTNLEGDIVSPVFIGGGTSATRKLVVPLAFTVRGYDETRQTYVIAPFNIGKIIAESGIKAPHTVNYVGDIKKILAWYLPRGVIYPFAIIRFFKLLYVSGGKNKLKNTLMSLYSVYGRLLNNTISTLKVPKEPSIPCRAINRYYVVYRRQRTFTATVITPKLLREICSAGGDGIIIDQNVSYLEVDNEDIAYYYAAILNYMIYKVKALNLGGFVRDQFGRPLQAIAESGLEWLGLNWQKDVADLSKRVSGEARNIALKSLNLSVELPLFELIDHGRDEDIKEKLGVDVEVVLNELVKESKVFGQIIEIVDQNIQEDILKSALKKYVVESKSQAGTTGSGSTKKTKSRESSKRTPASSSLERWTNK